MWRAVPSLGAIAPPRRLPGLDPNRETQACEAEIQAKAEKLAYANACGALAGLEAQRPDAALALEAAASVVTTLDFFVRPYAMQSRPLTRAEKIAALHAAIAAYERLW